MFSQEKIKALVFAFAIELGKLGKISHLLGSKFAQMSLSSMAAPVAGFFGSRTTVLMLYSLRTVWSLFTLGTSSVLMFSHIPTLGGTLYLAEESRLMKFMIPALAILFFLAHPTGLTCAWYSLYWVLPLVVAISNTRSIFLRSLASTLVCHAIGTNIWLYAGLIQEQTLYTLVSIVWLERLVSALAMTTAYYGISTAVRAIKRWSNSFIVSPIV